MSDSESDISSNVFTFQNENTMISVKGPNVNGMNNTNLSFRNNVLTSTMNMPRNFERQRYTEQSLDQRSMYYRRETSPVSMYSGSDVRARNFHQSYYRGGMGSQRSLYYGRSGSPMSMRSMDSNASVSAADIALAFKNDNFNKHDLRMIKDAYNKFMKRRIRKKIEKRRNMRLFLKGYRRKSNYDSGEQGSDSSISSDDCKSTSSAMYKDNMSCRSTRTDLSDFRRTIMDSNMYRDHTDNLKQNAFKNMLSLSSAANNFSRERFNAQNAVQNPPKLPQNEFAVPKQPFTQKERFKSGYLLPSQRFNKSVASMPILERDPRIQARQNRVIANRPTHVETLNPNAHPNGKTESDQEEIFSEVTVREKSISNLDSQHVTDQGKRGLGIEDSVEKCSDRKRPKLSSPQKQPNKANDLLKESKTNGAPKENKTATKKNKDNEENNKNDNNFPELTNNKRNDFEFLKPQFPVRKSGAAKLKEKLISKSRQPLTDEIIPPSTSRSEMVEEPAPGVTTEIQVQTEEQPDATQLSNSDLSMRPSFIKRKLFTQKMDVTEKKNLSSDTLNTNSPQTNVYSAIQKEKHKARKLVTNQSCLSRDIVQEGNNLLDLIHKIVPADRMNLTNVTNKTSISTSVSSKNLINDDDDKWDVTSVISTCNNDNCSETYTDEEIFGADDTRKKKSVTNRKIDKVHESKENNKKNNNVNKSQNNISKPTVIVAKPANECRVLVEKLPQNKLPSKPIVEVNKTTVPNEGNGYNNRSVYNCVKSFWDTDFESDLETPAPKRPIYKPEPIKENQHKSIVVEAAKQSKSNNKLFNVSLASVSDSIKSKTMPTNSLLKKFNISKTLSIKSYLTPIQVKSKPKTVKENQKDTEIPQIENSFNDINTVPEKKSTKQIKNPKHAHDNIIETKKVNTKNNGNLLNCTKTTLSKTKRKVSEKAKKSEPKIAQTKNNGDLLNTSKKTEAQPKKNRRTAKSQIDKTNKTDANKSIAERLVRRTPKRKACCDESHDDHNKTTKLSATKSAESKPKQRNNSNKKPKLAVSNPTKGRAAKTKNDSIEENAVTNKTITHSKQTVTEVNDNIVKESKAKVSKNNKKVNLKIEGPTNFEDSKMNRTLRSCRLRRIDLSSSINSSTETLQIRNLRTRRVDLSNSLNNSSFDETIKQGPRTNAVSKKVTANPNLTEVLNKQPRSVKNRT